VYLFAIEPACYLPGVILGSYIYDWFLQLTTVHYNYLLVFTIYLQVVYTFEISTGYNKPMN